MGNSPINSTPAQAPILKAVFFFSGFSSLIYQVVWQRLLTTYYGVGSVSITLIVSVYMFGLGLGALAGGFLAERVRKKIIIYFFIELLLGIFGLASLPFLSVLGRATAGSSYAVALGCMFLFLCIPTFLMGTTLPLLTKIYNGIIRNFLASISVLYFINTLGAAIGSLVASYIIISFFGLDTGIYAAAAINIVLAVIIFSARSLPRPYDDPAVLQGTTGQSAEGMGKAAYLLVFITGFLAIGYEIVWFRVIGVLVKESAYAFSSVLAVYLFGIALGSLWIERFIAHRQSIQKKNLFFILQCCIAVYGLVVIIGYYYMTRYTSFGFLTQLSFSQITHPNFDLLLAPESSFSFVSKKQLFIKIFALIDVFLWPLFFVLIPTMLMGASFPLVSSLALSRENREGSTVGRIYFCNILGNVLGGIVTGFILLPLLNTETTLLAFGITGLLFALLITGAADTLFAKIRRWVLTSAAIIAALLFFPSRGDLYKAMHNAWGDETRLSEGVDGVILTHHNSDPSSPFQTLLYINGSFHGFLPGHHFYAGAMEFFSYSPRPEHVLIIGYGIGTLTDAVLRSPRVKKVTLVELSETLMRNLKQLPFCRRTLEDSRLDLIIDDGRRYLIRTPETFDLIMMDPLKTTWAYSNNLYSQEFFRLAQSRLNKGGILCLFMGGEPVMAKTLISVFDHVRDYGGGFFASNTSFTKTASSAKDYLTFFSPADKESIDAIYKNLKCIAEKPLLQQITAGYPFNKDLKPILEYYLGIQAKEKWGWYN